MHILGVKTKTDRYQKPYIKRQTIQNKDKKINN